MAPATPRSGRAEHLRLGDHGHQLNRSRAARSRAIVRSWPKASSDSKRGGPTERPVTATRTGPCALLSCA